MCNVAGCRELMLPLFKLYMCVMILLYAVIVTDFLMRAKKEEILKLLFFRHTASRSSESCACVVYFLLFLFLFDTQHSAYIHSSFGYICHCHPSSANSNTYLRDMGVHLCVCEGENEQLLKNPRAYLHHCARTITEKTENTIR